MFLILQESEMLQSHSVKPVCTSNKACRAKMTDLVKELVDNGLI